MSPSITMSIESGLKAVAERASKLEQINGKELQKNLLSLIRELHRPMTVAVLGEFSAGKSTLINMLLGEKFLPIDPLPTTAKVALIQYGEQRGLVLRRRSGMAELRDICDLLRYGDKEKADPMMMKDIERIEVYFNHEHLREIRYLDTPGLGDPDEDARITLDALTEADAVIWCTTAMSAWKETEKNIWKKVPESLRKVAILVITYADALDNQQDCARILARVKRETENLFKHVFIVSLIDADGANKITHSQETAEPQGSLSLLRSTLKKIVHENAVELRNDWAMRKALVHVEEQRKRIINKLEPVINYQKEMEKRKEYILGEWKKFGKAVEKIARDTADELENIGNKAARLVEKIKTTEIWEEPQEYVEEGIFVDDHVVKYHEHEYDSIDFDSIQPVHEDLLNMVWECLVDRFGKFINDSVNKLIKSVDDATESPGSKIEVDEKDLTILLSLLRFCFQALIERISMRALIQANYLIGAINGGLYWYYANRQIWGKQKGHRRMPKGRKLRDEICEFIPFDDASERFKNSIAETLKGFDEHLQNVIFIELTNILVEKKDKMQAEIDLLDKMENAFKNYKQKQFYGWLS